MFPPWTVIFWTFACPPLESLRFVLQNWPKMIKFHCKCLVLLLLLALAKMPRLVHGGSGNPKAYHIGAIFNSMDNVNYFNRVIADIDYDGQSVPSGVHIYGHPVLKQSNGIDDVLQFCTKLMPNKVSWSPKFRNQWLTRAFRFGVSIHRSRHWSSTIGYRPRR